MRERDSGRPRDSRTSWLTSLLTSGRSSRNVGEVFFRRARSQHPFAELKRPAHPGRCSICRDVEADLELLKCPECRSAVHRACLHELQFHECPTLGCGHLYPLPGKARESPRHWALRRRARLREARRGLREAMFNAWAEQSRTFLMPFFGFALFSYLLSLGQWINLRPFDAAILVGLLGACTLRVYLWLLEQRKREAADVRRRVRRRHERWQASLEQASSLEFSSGAPSALSPPSQLSTPSLEPFPSSAWYPQSPPSEWGPQPPLPSY